MTVRELKELLYEADDEALVVVSGYDHSYEEAAAYLCTALRDGELLSEDPGEPIMPEEGWDQRVSVLLIR